nr:DUF4082 domain-containing protein [Tetrasphaera sp. HKS02]
MAAQPYAPIAGVTRATATTDTSGPTSTITSPAAGANLGDGTRITISGTAADTGGGVVAGVEVSTDGGTSWHPATGTTSWTYSWVAHGNPTTTIKTRAVDDSGNLETPGGGVVVNVGCTCSIWGTGTTPTKTDSGTATAVEVGVKFKSDVSGKVTGIRFYKASTNTGTHVGNLWTATGTKLASVTFTGESSSGWQQATFGTPVAINAGTTYVASYFAPVGHTAQDDSYFYPNPSPTPDTYSTVDSPPLHALRNAGGTVNGVFQNSSTSTFPAGSTTARNYWVDVMFTLNTGPATVPGAATGVTATPGHSSAVVTWTAPSDGGSVITGYTVTPYLGGVAQTPTTVTGSPPASSATVAGLTNGTAYTFTVSTTNAVGTGAASPASNAVTPSSTSCSACSIWPASATPATPDEADTQSIEVGVKFKSDLNGLITGMRFYKSVANTGTHIGNLWAADGTKLATGTFSNETASGWQKLTFATPAAVTAGAVYVVSYFAPAGHYAGDSGYFASAGVDNPPLHALQNGISGGNAVYTYSGTSVFPVNTYNSENYWVDVAFATAPATTPDVPTGVIGSPGDRSATIDWTAPADGGSPLTSYTVTPYVGTTAQPSTTVSGSPPPSIGTVTGLTNGTTYTFTVTANNAVGSSPASAATTVTPAVPTAPAAPASVTASAASGSALVSWSAPSSGGSTIATYTVTPYIGSIAQAPRTLSGSPPATSMTVTGLTNGTAYTFTVSATNSVGTGPASAASNPVVPATTSCAVTCTIWSATATPASPDEGDTQSTELGVKFKADVNGSITGMRFYKSVANTGTHVGNLWTSTGTKLATGTFSGETATGWQTLTFASPVAVTAGTIYVASYFAPVGHYAGDGGYFATSGVDNGPLHALKDGVSGGNGVYRYGSTSGFPTSTFNSENYWVDIAFVNGPTAPAAPSNVSATAGSGSAAVSWTAPFNGGSAITSYTVTPHAGSTALSPTTVSGSPPATSAAVTGLTNGTAYTFTVSATNAVGAGPDSPASTAVTPFSVSPPGAPTAVTATAANASAVVSWTAPGNGGNGITSYTVTPYVGTTAQAPTTISGSPPATTATVTGLTNGTAYTFTVSATNSVGTGSDSAPSAAVTPTTTPGAPTTVTATAGAGSAVVSWTAPSTGGSPISSYTVTPYIGATAQTPSIVSGSPPATSVTLTGLTNGTAYTFTVSATNAVGTGPDSAPSAAVTPVGKPAAPTAVTATAGDASATVSWTAPANGGSPITSYTITPYIGSSAQASTTISGNPPATSVAVSGLANGTSYTFTVSATNTAGTGPESVASNQVTPVAVAAPAAPTGVSATAGSGSAVVSWTAPSDGGSGITLYTVTPYVGSVAQAPATVNGSPPATSVAVTGLTNGTAYTFTVSATNAIGTSPESAASNQVTPATVSAPGAPTAVTATAGNVSAVVSWTAPADGGSPITGYTITPYIGSSAQASTTISGSPPATSAAVTGLTNGTTYTFTVSATNAIGTGPSSAASPPVTPATVPSAPTGVAATAGNASATVSWTAPSSGGSPITSYVVTPYIGGTAQAGTIISGSPPATAATISGLTNGTAYTFTVSATNAVGTGLPSAQSASVTPATRPASPTAVTATAGSGSAVVSWTAPSSGGSPITLYTVTPYIGNTAQAPVTVSGSPPATSVAVTGLTNGTAYTFTVSATNSVGTGPESAASNAVTPATVSAPGAPTGVTATAGNASATVTWTAPSNGGSPITGYTVTPYAGSTALASTTVSGSPPATTANVTGLTNGTAYTFTVAATNAVGTGSDSVASAAVTPATTPAAPGSVSATAGPSSAAVTWTAPTDGGSAITSYTVTPFIGATAQPPTTVSGSPPATTATVTGLTNGTAYTFKVSATNAIGAGPASAASAAVTPSSGSCAACTIWAPTATPTTPDQPDSSAVELGVKFRADVDGSITGIRFYKGSGNSGTHIGTLWASDGTKLASATFSGETATGWQQVTFATPVAITADTVYVASYFAPVGHYAGDGAYFASAGVDNGTLHALQDGVSGGDGVYKYGSTSAFPTDSFNATNYWVDVVFASGQASAPGAPSGVSATAGNTSATVTWTAPSNGGSVITSYTVTPYAGSTSLASTTVSGNPPATTANVTGLTNGTAYTFTVSATNAVGTGADSAASNVVTPSAPTAPAAPTNVTATAGNASAVVGWTAPSNGGSTITSYTVTPFIGATAQPATTVSGSPPATSVTVTGLTNGTAYTFKVSATNAIGTGPASAASAPVTPVSSGCTACTIWAPTVTPTTASHADSSAVELGVKFKVDMNGSITGIRFYKGSGNTGTHLGTLWSASGTKLASATFTGETATGWQQVTFTSPVAVTAGTVYVASYFAPVGHYAGDGSYFATSGVDNGPLHALQDGVSGGDGVYRYGSTSAFPTNSFNSTNYWVDVVFAGSATAPAAPTSVSAAAGNASAVVSWTAPPTGGSAITRYTVTPFIGSTAQSATIVNGSPPATSVTVAGLTNGTAYTFTVSATNAIGTGPDSAASNAVTPAQVSCTACTIWAPTVTPTTASHADSSAVELGVKFKVDVNGSITGIRFYKGSGNTGTHLGTLWSASGTKLASATFTGETATGWQQVTFTSPVAVTAGTVYVASYFAPVGHYAGDGSYFATSGVDNGPLHALQDGVSGGDGVYRYGSTSAFPTNSFNSTNYWVDVVFSTG